MKVYPYQSQPVNDPATRTTYIVRSNHPLDRDEIEAAIADLSLERTGWSEPHPLSGARWIYVEIGAPDAGARLREAVAVESDAMSVRRFAPA
jgi:hypothetical protein